MDKQTKWESGLYDLRPCLQYGVEKIKNAGFYIRYAKDITIEKSKVIWKNKCPAYSTALDAEHVDNIELIRFTEH